MQEQVQVESDEDVFESTFSIEAFLRLPPLAIRSVPRHERQRVVRSRSDQTGQLTNDGHDNHPVETRVLA